MAISPLTRRSILTVGGASAVTAIAMPAWAADGQRPGAVTTPTLNAADRAIINGINPGKALRHLKHLTETIGMRRAGTPAENSAARYIAGVLRGYGYQVQMQPFASEDKLLGRMDSKKLDARYCWDTAASTAGAKDVTVTGRTIVTDTADGDDLPADLSGRIVLRFPPANEDSTPLAKVVQERGGDALIISVTDAAAPPRQTSAATPRVTGDFPFPILGIGQVQKYELLEAIARKPIRLTVSTTLHTGLTSYNVLASRPGTLGPKGATRKDVMVCAHYDTVIGARGANDDGSGTVLCLELARVMRDLPTRHNIHFALWGSEELGLIGSRHYVKGLDEEARGAFAGVFNNDMVGTSWDPAEKYWVLSYDGKSNPVNRQVLAAGKRLGYSASMSDVTERGSSDHQSFQEVGVASGNFSWRSVETPAGLEPGYHSADDTIKDNISMERLTISMEIQGCAAFALAGGRAPKKGK